MEYRLSHSFLVGMQNGTVTLEVSWSVSYKTIHNPYDPAITFLGIYSNELKPLATQNLCFAHGCFSQSVQLLLLWAILLVLCLKIQLILYNKYTLIYRKLSRFSFMLSSRSFIVFHFTFVSDSLWADFCGVLRLCLCVWILEGFCVFFW